MASRLLMRARSAAICAVASIAAGGCSSAPSGIVPQTAAYAAPASNTASTYAIRTAGRPTGLILPLYVAPGKVWDDVDAAKAAHPGVPIAIIANVDNGPGTASNHAYVAAIERAQKAGIWVLGYVYTSNGKRSTSIVEAQMTRWYTLYHPDGIFMDEMSGNDPAYFTALTSYAHAHSLWFVMGNPGDDVPGNSGPDVINFYEQRGYPSKAFLSKPAHRSYGKSRWSYMAGAVPYDPSRIVASLPYVAYLYATDASEPECYCKLPTYFDQLVALLDR